VACYDMKGRVIRGKTQSFDNQWIGQDTEYDHFGRVRRASKNYKGATIDAGSPSNWSTNTYDVLGRATHTTAPDGTWMDYTYSGLTSTVTNSLGQQKTTIKNTQGLVAEVIDADYNSTSYSYDSAGDLVQVADANGSMVNMGYDNLGRKVAMDDPDMGGWTYNYNVLGELVYQQDAKGQMVTMQYDKLGRMTSRTEAEGTTTWTYDTAYKGIGKLAQVTGPDGYQQSYAYDALGRPVSTTTTIAGHTYKQSTTFDTYGRPDKTIYPTGFATQNVYTSLGFLEKVQNVNASTVYWQADAVDADGRTTMFTLGNGLTTVNQFNPLNGNLLGISTGFGSNSDVQYLTYQYDAIGNLEYRNDGNQSLTETFTYDNLNRLTSASIAGIGTKSYSYDAVGNLISKSDVGTYSYGSGGLLPHAVTSISGTLNGITNPSFSYDNNGNLTSGAGRLIDYTSYNKPSQIISNGQTVNFNYDPNHGRVIQTTADATTVYVGSRYEKISNTASGAITHKHYIGAGGGTVAIYTYESDVTSNTRYLHADQLGSIDTITNESGNVDERLSYDPFGQRRQSNWQEATGPITSLTPYGFTGQEHIEEVGLVHMNGRVYDPELGRFVSADPFVQFPHSTQGLNRYAYVNNNPLVLTDPSGFGIFGRAVHAFNKWSIAGRQLSYAIRKNPDIAVPLGSIIAARYCGAPCAAAFSAYATSTLDGSDQQAARNGAITYLTARAFTKVGDMKEAGTLNAPEATVAHGMVGGASSRASGGSFRSGFYSAAFTEAFNSSPLARMVKGNPYAYTAASATVGGVASVLGGGTFAQGAMTGAFSVIFNQCVHEDCFGVPMGKHGRILTELQENEPNAGCESATCTLFEADHRPVVNVSRGQVVIGGSINTPEGQVEMFDPEGETLNVRWGTFNENVTIINPTSTTATFIYNGPYDPMSHSANVDFLLQVSDGTYHKIVHVPVTFYENIGEGTDR